MSKALALPRRKTVDLRKTAANDPPLAFAATILPRHYRQAKTRSAPLQANWIVCTPPLTASRPRTIRVPPSCSPPGPEERAESDEEAGEVALEAAKHHSVGVVRESADLLYDLVVLWRHAGVEPAKVWTEMRRRANTYGIAEKLPKAPGAQCPRS